MLDAPIRKLIDPPLTAVASRIAAMGARADVLTVAGFASGLGAVVTIGSGHYLAGLGLLAANRVFDGLDGAVARQSRSTDLGAYLDISLDFIVYAAIPFAFALANPMRALAASFLIVSFVSTGTTFLAYAIIAAKRGLSTELRGIKSFYYLGGLTEGTETFIAFVLMCAFPQRFGVIAYVFGVLCFVTAGGRIAAAVEAFGAP
jgi:phosphatidylglycerophosphate synthase